MDAMSYSPFYKTFAIKFTHMKICQDFVDIPFSFKKILRTPLSKYYQID